jgi:hypothetical protein
MNMSNTVGVNRSKGRSNGAEAAGRPTEKELLENFDRRQQVIRDRVVSVVERYHTAVYIVGRPGTSKTHTVREELDRMDEPWVYQNARMTPMGLFGFISEHPEHVIVLDDIASLFKNDQAIQILMAALDGKPGEPRIVTYKSADVEQKVLFTGSIIAISNVPLRSDPLARALGSRVVVLEHEPTDDEVAAFIRRLAQKGYEDLSVDECMDVAEFITSETREFSLRLDLRHLTKAFQDFRQHKHGRSQTSWRDLVRTSLKKVAIEPTPPSSKKDEIDQQRQKVREAVRKHPDDRVAQIAESGLKQSTFYSRLKEVQCDTASNAA